MQQIGQQVQNIAQTNSTNIPAKGVITKQIIDGKEMLVVEVNRKKFPVGEFRWGKWRYKISNFSHVQGRIKVGDIVDGYLFRHKLMTNESHNMRFHIVYKVQS